MDLPDRTSQKPNKDQLTSRSEASLRFILASLRSAKAKNLLNWWKLSRLKDEEIVENEEKKKWPEASDGDCQRKSDKMPVNIHEILSSVAAAIRYRLPVQINPT